MVSVPTTKKVKSRFTAGLKGGVVGGLGVAIGSAILGPVLGPIAGAAVAGAALEEDIGKIVAVNGAMDAVILALAAGGRQ